MMMWGGLTWFIIDSDGFLGINIESWIILSESLSKISCLTYYVKVSIRL